MKFLESNVQPGKFLGGISNDLVKRDVKVDLKGNLSKVVDGTNHTKDEILIQVGLAHLDLVDDL